MEKDSAEHQQIVKGIWTESYQNNPPTLYPLFALPRPKTYGNLKSVFEIILYIFDIFAGVILGFLVMFFLGHLSGRI